MLHTTNDATKTLLNLCKSKQQTKNHFQTKFSLQNSNLALVITCAASVNF